MFSLGVLTALAAASANAEELYVQVAQDERGVVHIDIDSIEAVSETQVSVWVVQDFKTAQRVGGRTYTMQVSDITVDCATPRFAIGEQAFADRRGRPVREQRAPRSLTWEKVTPGSMGEKMVIATCGVAAAETVEDFRAGEWRRLGKSNGAEVAVSMDQVFQVGVLRVAVVRDDLPDYQLMAGIPYRYVLTSYAIDCQAGAHALAASDFYLSPTLLVHSSETAPDDLKLSANPRGSVIEGAAQAACAAKAVPYEDPESEPAQGGVGFGTAWASDKGYLITASHVVSGGGEILVYQDGVRQGSATVVANDPANDVAILKFRADNPGQLRIIPLSPQPIGLGREIFTLGYPEPTVMGARVKMASGQISGTAGIQDDARFMQISIPVQQGNSGGPVLGRDGSALGVISHKLTDFGDARSLTPENVNYAVKVGYIRPLLDDLPDQQNYERLTPSGSQEAVVDQVRQAVFMLIVGGEPGAVTTASSPPANSSSKKQPR